VEVGPACPSGRAARARGDELAGGSRLVPASRGGLSSQVAGWVSKDNCSPMAKAISGFTRVRTRCPTDSTTRGTCRILNVTFWHQLRREPLPPLLPDVARAGTLAPRSGSSAEVDFVVTPDEDRGRGPFLVGSA